MTIFKHYFLLTLLASVLPMCATTQTVRHDAIDLSENDKALWAQHPDADMVAVPARINALLCAMRTDVDGLCNNACVTALTCDTHIAPEKSMRDAVDCVLKAFANGYCVSGDDCCPDVVKKAFQEYKQALEKGEAYVMQMDENKQTVRASLKKANFYSLGTTTLLVRANEIVRGELTVGRDLTVGGNATVDGNLTVNTLVIANPAQSSLSTDNLTVTGNLTVDGTSTLDGLVTAGSGMNVTGTITMESESATNSGFAGPNGPLFQHARFWLTGSGATVASPAQIPLSNADASNSTGITLASNTITIGTPGVYLISYGAWGSAVGAPPNTPGIGLYQSGVVIPNTVVKGTEQTLAAGLVATSAAVLLTIATSSYTIQLYNIGGGITFISSGIATGDQQAYVHIVQIA